MQQLREASLKYGCAIHAYVLMTNHVHMLMSSARSGAISSCMQALGRRYVAYFNGRYHRSGTLWEGRYKSCPVDSQTYLLTCYRYIELNPVRAAMVATPADYAWTSYHCNALGSPDPFIQPHAEYLALGTSSERRQAAYRDLFLNVIGSDRLQEIRGHLQQQRALGSSRFQAAIGAELGRVATTRK